MQAKLLVISTFDSFAKHGKILSDIFVQKGFAVEFKLLGIKSALSKRQLEECNLPLDVQCINYYDLQTFPFDKYTAIYCSLTGAMIKRLYRILIKRLERENFKRPILIAGYPGATFNEKLIGFSNRSCCDIILFNSKSDIESYQSFCRAVSANSNNAFLYGYNFVPLCLSSERSGYEKNILFAEQLIMPKSIMERTYLVHRLFDYADANPTHRLYIKPRITITEKSIFKPKKHFENVLNDVAKQRQIPSNLILTYENISRILERSDTLLTVSSTVALEAMYNGIEVKIISDFGPNDKYGMEFFMDSGCLSTFDSIIAQEPVQLNEEWVHQNIFHQEKFDSLVEKVLTLYKSQDTALLPLNDNLYRCFSKSFIEFQEQKFGKKILFFKFWNYFRNLSHILKLLIKRFA